ncbi:MAG TPA: Ig-like domain-containing protein, partial [Candidatus Dormibacteraeota bacterium]
QAVNLVATISGSGGSPGGTVDFKDGATVLATRPVSGGRSSLSTAGLSVGDHPITAVYSGDSTYAGSTSPVVTQTVTTAGTAPSTSKPLTQTVSDPGTTASKTVVTSSANPAKGGQPVTFTATVSGAGGTPTGTVTFKDGANVLAVRPLAGGRSTLTIRTLTAGPHPITAVYGGSSTFAASTSQPLNESVTAGPAGSAPASPRAVPQARRP